VRRGPSAEEIRKQREAKDLNEAAEDANDKGAESYERGDWANAARYFREALEYDPDNPEIRGNLNQAQRKLELAHLAEAARQLKSAEDHARQAAQPQAPEASSEEARKRFDTSGKAAGTLDVSAVKAGTVSQKEPVVPAARRTPAITALETQRTESRKQAGVLDEKMKQLDPNRNAVELARAKQEKSTIESKIQYLNLSISELLETPAQNPPADAGKQKP
jgi:tetratricopeptide (TPR) repeat protein